MQWAPQQSDALREVAAWHRACMAEVAQGRRLTRPVFRLFGYAGTGKTTLAKHFADNINGATVFAAFTGKAALMMARKGCRDASTIHGLIYQVIERDDGSVAFVWDAESAAASADLILIDEVSMVDEEIALDLLRYNRPVLVLGDPEQLPPVRGAGFFTEAPADFMLTEIHRQARENPIIAMATAVREGQRLALGEYGASRVVRRGTLSGDEVMQADQVLVGKNDTRRTYNAKMRRLCGRESPRPVTGDRLVCLRNDRRAGIFNGGIFSIAEMLPVRRDTYPMILASGDFPQRRGVEVKVRKEFFLGGAESLTRDDLRGTHQFDYGYALTVHKAQGSQWDEIVLYDESGVFREEARRWLYTGITRAAEKLTLVTTGD